MNVVMPLTHLEMHMYEKMHMYDYCLKAETVSQERTHSISME